MNKITAGLLVAGAMTLTNSAHACNCGARNAQTAKTKVSKSNKATSVRAHSAKAKSRVAKPATAKTISGKALVKTTATANALSAQGFVPLAAPVAVAVAEPSRVLFDGTNLDNWTVRENSVNTIEDGVLAIKPGGGDIWSKERFGDFVLDLDVKVDKGTNSGVFIRTDSIQNWLHTGIEVQVLDSAAVEKSGKHDAGAIYDVLAPSANAMKPAGEWNHYTITAKQNVITVVLNDKKIIDMDLNNWPEAHKNPDGSGNKFNIAYKDMARTGHLGLQEHGNTVWYKNIRIRELK